MMKITKEFKAVSAAISFSLIIVAVCGLTVFSAGETVKLKDINSSNYMKYEKKVKAARGYNRGECSRKYLPHEEHFYSRYYDHWNVDVVYDHELIYRLYTKFEKTVPDIYYAGYRKKGVYLKWKAVKDAEKYVVYRKARNGSWKKIASVKNGNNVFTDSSKAGKGKGLKYRVRGIKHVRYWDVKTKLSGAVSPKK